MAFFFFLDGDRLELDPGGQFLDGDLGREVQSLVGPASQGEPKHGSCLGWWNLWYVNLFILRDHLSKLTNCALPFHTEPDVFYDTCDELGILVWQDFLFGCGLYPAYDAYVASVKVEAEQAVARLRDHPSLVVWVR